MEDKDREGYMMRDRLLVSIVVLVILILALITQQWPVLVFVWRSLVALVVWLGVLRYVQEKKDMRLEDKIVAMLITTVMMGMFILGLGQGGIDKEPVYRP
jgi:hypothetical protein